jgi:hypothetical protein
MRRHSRTSVVTAAGGNKDGVPPPKYKEVTIRPAAREDRSVISQSTADTYGSIRRAPPVMELNAQYAHLLTQNGTWM